MWEKIKIITTNLSFVNQVMLGGGIVCLLFMVFGFAATLVFGFAATQSLTFVLGIFIGGVCSILDFKALQLTLEKAMKMPPGKVPGYLQGRYMLRYLATGVIIYIVIINPWFNIIGVLLGLIVTKVSIYINQFFIKKGRFDEGSVKDQKKKKAVLRTSLDSEVKK